MGSWILTERLGTGRFGDVWVALPAPAPSASGEASDGRLTGTRVVIKLALASRVDALRREVATLSRLRSPHIAAPVAHDLTADPPYAVFPYIEGRQLRERLTERGTFPPLEALKIVADVLRGLSAAHRLGVVHCDVKPDNILVGNDGVARLLDFGIAAYMPADMPPGKPPPEAVAGSGVAGSPAYLAPEVRLAEMIRPAADVYAVGVVFFELLTGRLPQGSELPGDSLPALPKWANCLYANCCTDFDRRYPDASAALSVANAILDDGVMPGSLAQMPTPVAASPRPIRPTSSGRLPIPASLRQMRLPEPDVVADAVPEQRPDASGDSRGHKR
ncbi:MAG: serine/threonine-protein kinase [Planctomycetota bacterium]